MPSTYQWYNSKLIDESKLERLNFQLVGYFEVSGNLALVLSKLNWIDSSFFDGLAFTLSSECLNDKITLWSSKIFPGI